MRASLLVLLLSLPFFASAGEADRYYLIEYLPGQNFDEDRAYSEQPGLSAHHEYLKKLYNENVLVMGGPLEDVPGALMLVDADSIERAEAIAARDPAVVGGVLKARVSGWRLPMSSMRRFRRTLPDISDPPQPFKLEQREPDGPINIKD